MKKILLITLLIGCMFSCKKEATTKTDIDTNITVKTKLLGKWQAQSQNSHIFTLSGTSVDNTDIALYSLGRGYYLEYNADGTETQYLPAGQVDLLLTYKINGEVITDWELGNEATNSNPLTFKIISLTGTDMTLETTYTGKPVNDQVNNPKLDLNTTYKFVYTTQFKKVK
jgi:hypothetical protein